MKLSRSRVRTLLIGLVVAGVCLFGAVAPAFASLDDPPSGGTSSTNPNLPPAEWREMWGKWLIVNFQWTGVPKDVGRTEGFIYRVGRTPIEPVAGDTTAAISWTPEGTMLDSHIDIGSVYAEMSQAERFYAPGPGQQLGDPREGPWYLSVRFFNQDRVATTWWPIDFYIDVTPPRPIEGFTSGVTMPTETNRRTFTWLYRSAYDQLSGDARYLLYMDDLENPIVYDPERPGIAIIGWLPQKASFENIRPGKHTFGIRVMDKATNVSPMVTRTEIVDPGYPTVTISYPGEGEIMNGVRSFTGSATDDADAPTMYMKIDGVVKSVLTTSAPFVVDTRLLKDGKHTFTVDAKDLFGHVRSASRTFYVDNRRIGISSVGDSPDPFYPMKQDGYKDTTTIKAYFSERATDVFLRVYDEAGKAIDEQHSTNIASGWNSFTWDGKTAEDVLVDPGAFPAYKILTYQLIAKDAAGNWSFTGTYPTEIRNFEVIPLSSGKVKVVER